MEEGSPGAFLQNYRMTERSRLSTEPAADCEMTHEQPPTTPTELAQVPNPSMFSCSFKDKLMNKMSMAKNFGVDVNSLEADYDDLNDEEDVVTSCEERGPGIQFSKKAMTRLCEPWQHALIIKLLGRPHTYNFLHARLQQKWNLKGGWKLIDLVNDYFVVKFDLEEDLNSVLTGGPWIISGQYLVMQKWRPGFCLATAHITRMVAWI